jgi:hypothetical protein
MKSAKRIKGSQGKGYYTDRMEALTLEFSDIATGHWVITYTLTPIVSKKGGWRVSKKDTNLKDMEMEFMSEFLNMENDIYTPNKMTLKTPEQTYNFDFNSYIKHYIKRKDIVAEHYGDGGCLCDVEDEDCECSNEISKHDWIFTNMFMKSCGLFQILNHYRDKGISEFNKQELVGKECPVSLEPLKVGQTFKLPCDHYVSRDAFFKIKGVKKCPLCRAETEGGIVPM